LKSFKPNHPQVQRSEKLWANKPPVIEIKFFKFCFVVKLATLLLLAS